MNAEDDRAPVGRAVDNRIHTREARAVVQVGSVGGDIVFHGVPGAGFEPGLISIKPPADRLKGRLYGREHLVRRLLTTARRQDGSVVVLHGTGGSGKTAVALAVAQALSRDTDEVRVWWLDASTEKNLTAGFRELALDSGVALDEVIAAWSGLGSRTAVIEKALSTAADHWLLVIDNADDVRLLTGWRSVLRRSNGTVLITTRNGRIATWDDARELFPVGPLEEGNAAKMLLGLAPDCGSERQARELARTLGHLPLALHLAGRYLRSVRSLPPVPGVLLPLNFDHYRLAFHQRFTQLDQLHEIGGGPGGPSSDNRTLLTRTWELSLDLLHDLGMSLARPLMRWLSCFEQAAIPYDVIDARVLTHSDLFRDVTGMDILRTLIVLADFGLVEEVAFRDVRSSVVATRCLLLHPVIRESNRHQADLLHNAPSYLRLCIAVLDGFTCHLSTNSSRDLSQWAALIPHCEHVVDRIQQEQSALPPEWELLATKLTCAVARFAQVNQGYARAESLFRHALAVRSRHLGGDHPETLALRRELAWLRWNSINNSNLDQAGRCVQEFAVLADHCEEALGLKDPLTLRCRLDLAWIRSGDSNGDEIADHYGEVVRLARELHGHPETTGLTAQIDLVSLLWRRTQETNLDSPVLREMMRLLVMINDMESQHSPEELPVPIFYLRDTVSKALTSYTLWRHRSPTANG